ncbi:MAG: hypothetical protein Q7U30_09965 [Methylicorpusculum sp.]|nr:hypothetical protein [Methylicorpusculum sp.]
MDIEEWLDTGRVAGFTFDCTNQSSHGKLDEYIADNNAQFGTAYNPNAGSLFKTIIKTWLASSCRSSLRNG